MDILADKIRPQRLDDILGQEHLIGPNKVIRNLINNQKMFSMIFYGRPGTGKTTLAKVIINELNCRSFFLNAAINNKSDFEQAIYEAKLTDKSIIVIDEIHRMNKDKQDILLPYLENGSIILIGLTTSNPYLKVNPAIRSRVSIFELHDLTIDDMVTGLKKACSTLDDIKCDEESLRYIANLSGGDMRSSLNLLEIAYYSSNNHEITIENIQQINNKPNIYIDGNGDGHYDLLSALQKSIRGSDPDAAIFYLARLLVAEDLDSIERRLSVIAYEDIGLANPGIGPRLDSAINAAERVGLPEARLIFASIVIEMALSPKSNSAYLALDAATNDINKGLAGQIPKHIKNGSKEYKYPHQYHNNYVKQQYLPDSVKDHKYYRPQNNKIEKNLYQVYMERISEK